MEKYKDSFGTEIIEGDCVAFSSSYNKGSTTLTKGIIVSFTKKGNPRVLKDRFAYNAETGKNEWGLGPVALVGSYVKTYDSTGIPKI